MNVIRRLGTNHRLAHPLLGFALAILAALGAKTASAEVEAPLLDASHGKRAHQLVEQWVRAGEVPEPRGESKDADDKSVKLPPSRPVTGLFGVRITLRLSGRRLGMGQALREDVGSTVDGPGPPVDLVKLVRQAAARAMSDARESLLDARWRAVKNNTGTGDTGGAGAKAKTPKLAQLGERIVVGIQLGHHLQSIHLAPSAPIKRIYTRFAPGFHGLRIDGPNQPGAAYDWPATALALNASPRSQIIQTLDDEGYPIAALEQLAKPGGPALQRFEVVHVVRPQRDLSPRVLIRGNVPLPKNAITGEALDHLSQRLAGHLARQFIRQGQVRGTYHPSSATYDPPLASDRQRALAAYALSRAANYRLSGNKFARHAEQYRDQALDVAEQIARKVLEKSDKPRPAVASLALLALVDSPIGAEREQLRNRLGQHLLDLRNDHGVLPIAEKGAQTSDASRSRSKPRPGTKPAGTLPVAAEGNANASEEGQRTFSQPVAALATAAIASLYQRTRTDQLHKATANLLQNLWTKAGVDMSITALPWFAMAHQRSAKLLAESADEQATAAIAKRRKGLAELVQRLGQQQIIRKPLLGPNDVDGGFALEPAPSGSPPAPDWRTAHLLQFLAANLRDDKMIRDMETFVWVLTAGRSARFIDQLMMDRYGAFYAASPEDALGGVRLTLWDNRLAIAPTAVSLLAVTELQQAVDEIAKRNKPENSKEKPKDGNSSASSE